MKPCKRLEECKIELGCDPQLGEFTGRGLKRSLCGCCEGYDPVDEWLEDFIRYVISTKGLDLFYLRKENLNIKKDLSILKNNYSILYNSLRGGVGSYKDTKIL